MSPYDYKLKNAKTIQHMSREGNFSEKGAQKNRLDETNCLVPTTMFGLDETKLFMH